MKPILTLLAIVLCSCSSTQIISMESAPNVQNDITALGKGILPSLTAAEIAKVHAFAVGLAGITQQQLIADAVTQILPQLSGPNAALINGILNVAVNTLNSALSKYGAYSAGAFLYSQALANGLLNAGF